MDGFLFHSLKISHLNFMALNKSMANIFSIFITLI